MLHLDVLSIFCTIDLIFIEVMFVIVPHPRARAVARFNYKKFVLCRHMDAVKCDEYKLKVLLTEYKLIQEKIVSKSKFIYQILGALGAANFALLGYSMVYTKPEICLLIPFIILFGISLFLMELNGRVRLDSYVEYLEEEIHDIVELEVERVGDWDLDIPSMRYPAAFALIFILFIYIICTYMGVIWLCQKYDELYAITLVGTYFILALSCVIYYVNTEALWSADRHSSKTGDAIKHR